MINISVKTAGESIVITNGGSTFFSDVVELVLYKGSINSLSKHTRFVRLCSIENGRLELDPSEVNTVDGNAITGLDSLYAEVVNIVEANLI